MIEMMFPLRTENLRPKTNDTGPVALLIYGYSIHVTGRVIAFAESERILIIWLVPPSPHLSQPRDLSTFGLFKILDKKEQKIQKLKGETFEIDRALHAFYKATVIPMVQWSLNRAGFWLNSDNLLALLPINRAEGPARISVPEMFLEQFVFRRAH
jgi:hypothetical protein